MGFVKKAHRMSGLFRKAHQIGGLFTSKVDFLTPKFSILKAKSKKREILSPLKLHLLGPRYVFRHFLGTFESKFGVAKMNFQTCKSPPVWGAFSLLNFISVKNRKFLAGKLFFSTEKAILYLFTLIPGPVWPFQEFLQKAHKIKGGG